MNNFLFQLMIAALAGAACIFAWAPFFCWVAGLICYGILYGLLQRSAQSCQAFLLGFIFAFGTQLTGHFWIYTSLHDHAGMSVSSAVLSMLAFAAYYSCITGFFCSFWKYFCKLDVRQQNYNAGAALLEITLFSILLCLSEMLRGSFTTGFSSLSLGYALLDTPLANFAPLTGVYGVSLSAYFISANVAVCIGSHWRIKKSAILNIFLISVAVSMLGHVRWIDIEPNSYSFSLIQTGVAQDEKFDSRHIDQNRERLLATIEANPANLIVTPETAFAQRWTELSTGTVERLQNFSRLTNSDILIGVSTISADSDGYNSVVHINPLQRGNLEQYHKVRLMPFGEYSPQGFAWFSENLRVSFKNLSAGSLDQVPFHVGQMKVASLICHEDLFGDDVRRWLPETGVFINPGNLAWFDDSIALEQRLQIARMRAKESGRPILRVTNTGVTAQIDVNGSVVARLAPGIPAVLHGRVSPASGITPYMQFGDNLLLALLIITIIFLLLAKFRMKRDRTSVLS
jgi:apolipoprotein N-acyltransferase